LIITTFIMFYIVLINGLAVAASTPFQGKDTFLLVAYTVQPCITMGIIYPCLVVLEHKKSGNKTSKKELVPHQFLILQGVLIGTNMVIFILVPFMIYFQVLFAPLGAIGGTLTFYVSYLCYGGIIVVTTVFLIKFEQWKPE